MDTNQNIIGENVIHRLSHKLATRDVVNSDVQESEEMQRCNQNTLIRRIRKSPETNKILNQFEINDPEFKTSSTELTNSYEKFSAKHSEDNTEAPVKGSKNKTSNNSDNITKDDDDTRVCKPYYMTFYDQEQEDNGKETSAQYTTGSSIETATTIKNTIHELIMYEEKYVGELRRIVKKYKPYVYENASSELRTKMTPIFGNIELIYAHAKKFLALLKQNSSTAQKIAHVFIDEESTFKELYPSYAKNYAIALTTILESDKKLKISDQTNLRDILNGPIHQFRKYELLLNRIQQDLSKSSQSTTQSTTSIEFVRKLITEINTKSNDLIATGCIKLNNMDISIAGSFIMKEKFKIIKPKILDCVVFLFQEIIVFTQVSSKNKDLFDYVNSIRIKELGIEKFEDKNTVTFHLKDYSKKVHLKKKTYILEAATVEIKFQWVTKLQEMLWRQVAEAREQQIKLYKSRSKETSVEYNVKL